ncbi:MAG TPA: type II toxin-antitoxin system RelE/ParE family toxin [Opitutaceae bacterium]|jgi:plasmid stabilization system protein ParE|nr:type II toxin-antitoxin system RelE/ParE family toxin [Opitutaceae bacterium]
MDYRVTLAAQADRDLEEIVRFLAQKNPTAAERLGYALLDDALTLANMPRRGLAVQERPGYRRILHRPWFLIFYRIDEARRLVEVARIWDARQDPDTFSL